MRPTGGSAGRSQLRSARLIRPIRCAPEDTVTTRSVIFGSSRLVSAKCPRWFTPSCISNPSAVRPNGTAITPALLIKTSNGSVVSAANARTESRLARSSRRISAPPGISAAARSPLAVSRTAKITSPPAPARIRAASNPMPLLPR